MLLYAAVTILLLGHIHSAVITPSETITTSSPEQDPSAATPEAPAEHVHYHIDNHLQVDSSNPILGDIPIFEDKKIDIINRNRKLQKCIILHSKCIIILYFLDVPLRNCKEILDYGSFNKSGLYVVQPGMRGGEFVVYCDMTLLGGGWTVIQRRRNSKLSFDRTYSSYANGFGDFTENYWLGLDKISRLTRLSNSNSPMEVYFGIEAFFDYSTFSRYSQFLVGTEKTGYQLKIGGYNASSTAKDSMSFYNDKKFSTRDKDQEERSIHCERTFEGHNSGWWFRDCVYTNLNGIYYEHGPNRNVLDGISWRTWTSPTYSLKNTVIAIRPTE